MQRHTKPCTHSVFKLVKELKLCGILPENVLNEMSLVEMIIGLGFLLA
jgi:biotin-(acetyl-CoA carboxylase) ligase